MANEVLAPEIEIFLKRAAPHFIAGKSVEDSMRAVLDDDARLVGAFFEKASSQFFPTADERGRSVRGCDRRGDLIAAEISATVYAALQTGASA